MVEGTVVEKTFGKAHRNLSLFLSVYHSVCKCTTLQGAVVAESDHRQMTVVFPLPENQRVQSLSLSVSV
jgi:hypothetical protein